MLQSFYDNDKETYETNMLISSIIDNKKEINDENSKNDSVDIQNETTDIYVDCLNIHQIYFKHLYNKDNESHMLENIDVKKENDTTRSMELFFESLHTYKEKLNSEPDFCDIYDVKHMKNGKINEYPSMFALKINNVYHKFSPSLFAIITYIAHCVDWKNDNWHIISLKESD